MKRKLLIRIYSALCVIAFTASCSNAYHEIDHSLDNFIIESRFVSTDSTVNLQSRLAESYFISAKSKQIQYDTYNAMDEYYYALHYSQSPVIISSLADQYLSQNNVEKAIEYYNISIKLDSTYMNPYHSLIDIYLNQQEYLLAEKVGSRLICIDQNQENELKLAAIYHNLDLNKSIDIIKKCIVKFNNYELYLYLSDIYKYQHNTALAEHFEEQYYLSPNKIHLMMDNLTEMNIKNKQLSLSVKYIDTLQKYCSDRVFNLFLEEVLPITIYRDPFDFNTVYKLIKAINNATLPNDYKNVYTANLKLNVSDTLSAIEMYMQFAHSSTEMMLVSIITNFNYERYEDAYRIIKANPDLLLFYDINQYSRVLQLLVKKNDFKTIIIVSKNAINSLNLLSEKNFLLPIIADAYMGLNDYDSALVYYKRAFEIYPENIHLRNNYAYVLALSRKEYENALMLIEYSLSIEPNNPYFLDTYGWINFLLGNVDIAYNSFVNAIHLMPQSVDIHLHLGYVLYYKGEIAGAIDHWEKAYRYQDEEGTKLIK